MDTFLKHLAEKRGKLQKQLQKLQGEIADLDKAERLYRESGAMVGEGFLVPRPPVPPAPPPQPPPAYTLLPAQSVTTVLPGAGKTIKERVIQLLERNPAGLTSSQILNTLNIDGGQPVSRESLSPQLSRLRTADGKIDLKDGVWSVQKRENPASAGGVFE